MLLLPQVGDPRKDRKSTAPMKKGGSRSYRPFEFYAAAIPGQPAGLSYDVQLHIGESRAALLDISHQDFRIPTRAPE